MGKLFIVSLGPGNVKDITQRAKEAISDSQIIIGLKPRIDIIKKLIHKKNIIYTGDSEAATGLYTGLAQEVDWVKTAIEKAEQGNTVSLLSSGDSTVYGIAGLICEVLRERGLSKLDAFEFEVIPGITALNAASSSLGAPLMQDFAVISLSDLLTPWRITKKRLEAVAQSDFVIVIYNPKAEHIRRCKQIAEAHKILLKHRDKSTPVGIVNSAKRTEETVQVTTLESMLKCKIGMLTTIIVGNSSTFIFKDLMATPRGYKGRYSDGRWRDYLS